MFKVGHAALKWHFIGQRKLRSDVRVPKEGWVKSRSQSWWQHPEHKHLHNQFHLCICFWLIWRLRVKAADLKLTFSRVVPSPSPAKRFKAFTLSTWQHPAATEPDAVSYFCPRCWLTDRRSYKYISSYTLKRQSSPGLKHASKWPIYSPKFMELKLASGSQVPSYPFWLHRIPLM